MTNFSENFSEIYREEQKKFVDKVMGRDNKSIAVLSPDFYEFYRNWQNDQDTECGAFIFESQYDPEVNYYEFFKISRNATQEEIKKAYRKLSLENHPDKFPNSKEKEEAEDKFTKIAAAYRILGDPFKRKKYDFYLDKIADVFTDQHDFYKVLGLGYDASYQDIEKKYEYLKENFENSEFASYKNDKKNIFKKINQAYKTLSDEKLRKIYDFNHFCGSDLYKALGVRDGKVSYEKINEHYNELRKIFEQEDNDKKELVLKKLNHAYKTLSNPLLRAEYDLNCALEKGSFIDQIKLISFYAGTKKVGEELEDIIIQRILPALVELSLSYNSDMIQYDKKKLLKKIFLKLQEQKVLNSLISSENIKKEIDDSCQTLEKKFIDTLNSEEFSRKEIEKGEEILINKVSLSDGLLANLLLAKADCKSDRERRLLNEKFEKELIKRQQFLEQCIKGKGNL